MRFTREEVETIRDALFFAAVHSPVYNDEYKDLIFSIERRQRKK